MFSCLGLLPRCLPLNGWIQARKEQFFDAAFTLKGGLFQSSNRRLAMAKKPRKKKARRVLKAIALFLKVILELLDQYNYRAAKYGVFSRLPWVHYTSFITLSSTAKTKVIFASNCTLNGWILNFVDEYWSYHLDALVENANNSHLFVDEHYCFVVMRGSGMRMILIFCI